MFDWFNRIGLAQRHRLISQNFSAIEAAGRYYVQKNNEEAVKHLEKLEAENLRIANVFYEKQDLSSEEVRTLNELHAKLRAIFEQIYPGKNFDRTFVPGWTRDSEIKD